MREGSVHHSMLPQNSKCEPVSTPVSPLYHHCVTTVSSLCHHCITTVSTPVSSLHQHCITTASPLYQPLCHHCIIPVSPLYQPLCHHCIITVSPLCHHCIITVSTLCHHCVNPCVTTISSLHHHCVNTVSPLCHHCINPCITTVSTRTCGSNSNTHTQAVMGCEAGCIPKAPSLPGALAVRVQVGVLVAQIAVQAGDSICWALDKACPRRPVPLVEPLLHPRRGELQGARGGWGDGV